MLSTVEIFLAAHWMKITFKENVLSDGSLIRRILSVND